MISGTSRMMKMKNHWQRFCGKTLVGFALGTSCFTSVELALGQQGVAPPSQGYGRPASNQPVANPAPRTGQPVQQQLGQPQQGQRPQQPGQPAQGNPNLNPAFNQAPGGAVPGQGSGRETVTKDPYAANPLSPQEIAHLDQILNHWEKSTADIEKYSSKVIRWKYKSTDNFVEQLAQQTKMDVTHIHTTVAAGVVKYSKPDMGMFKLDEFLSLTGSLDANGKPEYKAFANQFGEWWLCDGKAVYEYDRSAKRCTIHDLPEEVQGAAILDSPMPFVFGVKAEKLKQRYWVRALPPPNKETYVIEVYPKFQSDAINYDHVRVYLDAAEFLPIMLEKFDTEYLNVVGQPFNDSREIFQFSDRVKNQSLIAKVVNWGRDFIPFDAPKDWEVTRVPYAPPATQDIRAATANPIGNPALGNAPQGNRGPVSNPNAGNPNPQGNNPNLRNPAAPGLNNAPTKPIR